jgi:hypothetical protein
MDSSRRSVLKMFAGSMAYAGASSVVNIGALAALSGISRRANAQSTVANPIVLENANPGTANWKLGSLVNGVQYLRSDDEKNQIAGYATYPSVTQTGVVDFHISVNASSPDYVIEIFRLGYYQGYGARLLQTISKNNGVKQIADNHSNLIVDQSTGRVECGWQISHSQEIPADWVTGIYIARLTNSDRYQSHIVFCVRNASATADLLYVQPTLTYQAYNGYPFVSSADFPYPRVGRSLYPVASISCASTNNPITNCLEGVAVSYDRPYTMQESYVGNVGNGVSYDSYTYEPFFIRWAEQNGYALDYVTDVDIDAQGITLLENYKGIVFPGHFEYLTKNIRDSLEQAKNQSVHLAFLGANPAYYQVRLEDSPNAAGKTVVAYKGFPGDPLQGTLYSATFFDAFGRADALLAGVGHMVSGTGAQIMPLNVCNAAHWVWNGSGATNGMSLTLLGYEVDVKGLVPFCKADSYTLLCNSNYLGYGSNASIYQAYSNAWVFAAGTMSWTWGLSPPVTYDGNPIGFFGASIPATYNSPVVQAATKNLLDKFVGDTTDHRRRSDTAFALADTSLWLREYSQGGWSDLETLSGAAVFAPAILSRPSGDLDVFATSAIGCLWVKSRRNTSWQSWKTLLPSGSVKGQPVAAMGPGGSVDVFVLNNASNYLRQNCTDTGWGNWENLGGSFRSAPTAVNYGDITELFGISNAGDLQTTTIVNGVSALGWTSLGGKVDVGGCGATADGSGALMVAVVGVKPQALWTRVRSSSTGTWTPWFNSGESLSTTPVVVSPYPGRFDVIAKLADNSIATITCTNGEWSEWVYHRGAISGDPNVVVANTNIVVCGLSQTAPHALVELTIAVPASGGAPAPGQWATVGG